MSEEKCQGSSMLVAFLVGAAVGGGIALLTAPRSGRETREKLRGLAGETRERIRQIAEDAEEKIAAVLNEGKETIAHKRDMVKAAVEAGREAMAAEKAKYAKD
jgi:gas vesicle protein